MNRENSLINTLKKLSDQLQRKDHIFDKLSPRSVESKSNMKSFSRNLSIQKQIVQERQHLYKKDSLRIYPYGQQQRPYSNYLFKINQIDTSPYYHELKRHSSFSKTQLYSHKQRLIRSNSMNQMYKRQRIQILGKINAMLDNQQYPKIITTQRHFQKQINQRKQRKNITQRVYRLQKYLGNIRKQRQREDKPLVISKIINNKQPKQKKQLKHKQIQRDNLNPQNDQHNFFGNAFHQLDKIKVELTTIRNQALQTKKRYSLSKQNPKKYYQIQSDIPPLKQLLKGPITIHRPFEQPFLTKYQIYDKLYPSQTKNELQILPICQHPNFQVNKNNQLIGRLFMPRNNDYKKISNFKQTQNKINQTSNLNQPYYLNQIQTNNLNKNQLNQSKTIRPSSNVSSLVRVSNIISGKQVKSNNYQIYQNYSNPRQSPNYYINNHLLHNQSQYNQSNQKAKINFSFGK